MMIPYFDRACIYGIKSFFPEKIDARRFDLFSTAIIMKKKSE